MRARHRGKFGTYYYLDTGDKPRKEIFLGKDYVMAVQKWAELTASVEPVSNLITFKYAAERYVEDVLPTKASRTQKDNKHELTWLYKFFNNPPGPLDSIKPIHIRQYIDWRTAKVRANREKALFSHIWNYARGKGLTDLENPCSGIKGNKETGRDIYIDDAILAAVYDCAEIPLRDALNLAYLTGQRPADILKYTRADIKDGALWVTQNKSDTKVRVAIKGELDAALKQAGSRKVMGMALINNMKGQPMTQYMLRGAFDRARIAAKLKYPELADEIAKFQFRDLRAKAGTDKEESQGMEAAQAQLGHSTPGMTAHYVRHRKGKLVDPTK
jgi:integrase